MKTINVSCDRLYAAKVGTDNLIKQIQDWEATGYRINFQIHDQAGLTFLQTLVAAQQDKTPSNTRQFVGLFLVGIVAGLITISVGWIGLLR